ncbi:hypothetical protein Tco_1093397 [Tanacetum coccineum]|uniref:Uncharacterized protein n=1 Tax=Tanacetum coccineum TaxID=301880 RepID=A0ABQ5IDV8_9ASTR
MLATDDIINGDTWFLRYIDTRPNGDALTEVHAQSSEDLKTMQKNLALTADVLQETTTNLPKTTLNFTNTRNKNVELSQAKEMQKAKTVKDFISRIIRKKDVAKCKQAEKESIFKQSNLTWLADTYKEIDETRLEAH